jgi:hypothetical protein
MTRIGRHVFVAGDVTTWNGQATCAHCPLPHGHEIHDLPAQDPDVAEVEARRLGERVEP